MRKRLLQIAAVEGTASVACFVLAYKLGEIPPPWVTVLLVVGGAIGLLAALIMAVGAFA